MRNLERAIGSVFRRAAMQIAEGATTHVVIDAPDLAAILGPARFENEVAMRTSLPGVATGLAWTPVGGDVLFVEASRTPGNGKLILTGQLGDVMKESAQTALTLVKARSAEFEHRAGALREERHPRARAGGRHSEGRAQRGRRDVHRPRLADDQPSRCAATSR